ncbi:MAG: HAD-IIB family hydrolase [Pseudomonadota bacterium]
MTIALVVCDIEGCLTPGKGEAMDLGALARVAGHNLRARSGAVAPLTLCTGRPQPFVEAMCQMLRVFLPCVCENGALLYDPAADAVVPHPDVTPQMIAASRDLRRFIETDLARRIPLAVEPGKEICISLNPRGGDGPMPGRVARLHAEIAPRVDPALFTVTHSNSAVDITPRGIDKGAGLRVLADMTGVALADMLAIGDAPNDLPFLTLAGTSACPANAHPAVKAVVTRVAGEEFAAGVTELLSANT